MLKNDSYLSLSSLLKVKFAHMNNEFMYLILQLE
jgi:hypothetical protein